MAGWKGHVAHREKMKNTKNILAGILKGKYHLRDSAVGVSVRGY
jgi:hypothetical protein